jgi:hypothetical protein
VLFHVLEWLRFTKVSLPNTQTMKLTQLFLFVILAIANALPTKTSPVVLVTGTPATKDDLSFQIFVNYSPISTSVINVKKSDTILSLIEKVSNRTNLSSNYFRLSNGLKSLDVNTKSDLTIGDYGIFSDSTLHLLPSLMRRV